MPEKRYKNEGLEKIDPDAVARPRETRTPDTMKVTIGPKGRLVVPAALRRRLGMQPGAVLLARAEGNRLVLERPEAVLARLRSRYAQVPASVSLADELIAERREEARRENEA